VTNAPIHNRPLLRRPGLDRRAFSLLAAIALLLAGCGDGGAPSASPAAATLLSTVNRIAYAQNGDLYTVGADGSDRRLVAEGGQQPVWSPQGDRIAFVAPPSAVAQGRALGSPYLDLHVVNADGSQRRNLTGGATGPGGILGFSWSPDGSRIAIAAGGAIYEASVDGSRLLEIAAGLGDLGATETASHSVAWSPDGRLIAFTNGRINLIEANGGNPRQVGDRCGDAVEFSPDSKRLAVACNRTSLYVIGIDGSDERDLTAGIDAFDRMQSFKWSPDGTRVVFDTQRPRELWVANADGSGITTLPNGRTPSWSPDGTQLAYACPEVGWQLCVVSSDGASRTIVTDSKLGPIDSLSVSFSPMR
jgi:TolB protein